MKRRVFVAIRAGVSPRRVVEKYFLFHQIHAEVEERVMNRWYFIVSGDSLFPFSPDDEITFAIGDRPGYAEELLACHLPQGLERKREEFKKPRGVLTHEC